LLSLNHFTRPFAIVTSLLFGPIPLDTGMGDDNLPHGE
jgi:hypothetical protein